MFVFCNKREELLVLVSGWRNRPSKPSEVFLVEQDGRRRWINFSCSLVED